MEINQIKPRILLQRPCIRVNGVPHTEDQTWQQGHQVKYSDQDGKSNEMFIMIDSSSEGTSESNDSYNLGPSAHSSSTSEHQKENNSDVSS